LQHLVDFGWMVKHSTDEGRQPIDLEKLEALGEMVWPHGGGQEILRMIEQHNAGKQIMVDSLGGARGGKE
jgi:hypothetical protein